MAGTPASFAGEGLYAIPWVNVAEALFQILEIAGVIPDPLQLIMDTLTGRPRGEATLQVASRLLNAKNEVAIKAGVEYARMYHEWNIVISDSSASGHFWLGKVFHQFVYGMVAQGVGLAHARNIAVFNLSRAAQDGAALAPELKTPIVQPGAPNVLTIMGDSRILIVRQAAIAQADLKGYSCHQRDVFINRYILQHVKLGQLLNSLWQIVAQDKIIPPPPPPSEPPPPPMLGQPDPEGDEITDTLCRQMQANTSSIIYQLQQMQGGLGGGLGSVDACCVNIVDAIKAQTDMLQNILAALPAAPTAIDLTGVLAKLQAIADAAATPAPAIADLTAATDDGLASIANAIASITPADLAGLKDAILHAGEKVEGPDWIKQILVDAGAMTAVEAQQLGDYVSVHFRDAIAAKHAAAALGASSAMPGWVNGGAGAHRDDWLTSTLNWFIEHFDTELKKLHKLNLTTDVKWKLLGADLLDLFQTVFGGFGKFAQDTLLTGFSKTGDVFPDAANENFGKMIANASALGGAAYGAATVGGLLLGEHSKHLNYFAALFAMGAGYDMIAEGALKAFIWPTITEPNRQYYNALYRSHIPDAHVAERMFARGIIDRAQYQKIIAAEGLRSDFEPATLENSYHGMSPRIMLRTIETGLFSPAEIADELTFSQMRPASQKRLISASHWIATNPQRTVLMTAIEEYFTAGLISESDLTARVDSANHNVDRDSLILETVRIKKQIALAKEYEAGYSREFLAALIDLPTYQANLEHLGMQPEDVAARLFRDEVHANVTFSIAAAREQRALIRSTATAERRAAIEAFRAGSINSAGLAAALASTGLTAVQVAAQVTYQRLALTGVDRWIYGLQLQPRDAALLKQRVTALTDQRKRQLTTDAQYVSALQALKLPDRVINALQAAANASISPKSAAILTPVSTG